MQPLFYLLKIKMLVDIAVQILENVHIKVVVEEIAYLLLLLVYSDKICRLINLKLILFLDHLDILQKMKIVRIILKNIHPSNPPINYMIGSTRIPYPLFPRQQNHLTLP